MSRAVFCIWCGESVAYGRPTRKNVRAAYDAAKAHDAVCPKNPLVARIKELERGEAPPECDCPVGAAGPWTPHRADCPVRGVVPAPPPEPANAIVGTLGTGGGYDWWVTSRFGQWRFANEEDARTVCDLLNGGVRAVPAPQEGPGVAAYERLLRTTTPHEGPP